jgi:hypothetical protein
MLHSLFKVTRLIEKHNNRTSYNFLETFARPLCKRYYDFLTDITTLVCKRINMQSAIDFDFAWGEICMFVDLHIYHQN